jgi:hypothetical protein
MSYALVTLIKSFLDILSLLVVSRVRAEKINCEGKETNVTGCGSATAPLYSL